MDRRHPRRRACRSRLSRWRPTPTHDGGNDDVLSSTAASSPGRRARRARAGAPRRRPGGGAPAGRTGRGAPAGCPGRPAPARRRGRPAPARRLAGPGHQGPVHQPDHRGLRRHLRRPGGHPRQGRLLVPLRHQRPARRGRTLRDHARGPVHRPGRAWEYLGTIFDETTRPAWATPTSFFWAPDIRYVDGRYVLYYTVTDTAAEPGDSSAIGAATAPTPAGPWTDTGGPVVAPRPDGGGGYYWTFDPAMFLDDDGRRYLYFGAYHGGVWVTEPRRDRPARRRRAHPGHYRRAVRGHLRRQARRALLPDGLLGELLRRPGHRVQRLRRAGGGPAGPVRGPRGRPAARPPTRRHPGAGPERQPVDRPRAPHRRRRPVRPGPDPLPRPGPEPAVAGRARRHQPPPHPARPARLDRRLAAGPGRRRPQRLPQPAPSPAPCWASTPTPPPPAPPCGWWTARCPPAPTRPATPGRPPCSTAPPAPATGRRARSAWRRTCAPAARP